MKLSATLFACITLSLVLASETASAGNRFSGKSSGRSSNRSSNRSFNNRSYQNNHNKNNFSKHNFNNRTFSTSQKNHFSTMQRNASVKKFTPKQNYRKPQTHHFTNRHINQNNVKKTNNSNFTKSKIYTFSPKHKQMIPTKNQNFQQHHKFNQHHKPTQRPFKTNFKPVKHNFPNGHHSNHHNTHHTHHKGHHHGHKHWSRPWCHINYRPVCPTVCRPWYPVVCADPIVTPCVITSCAPVTYNEFNEPLVAAPVIAEEEIVAATEATQEQTEPERLELVAGQKFQLSAEGLGTEQGMVVLEINEMGLPAKIEKWEDTALGFQTPQIGLSKATEAKMHIMNKKGQLLATLDINLLPEATAGATQVAAN